MILALTMVCSSFIVMSANVAGSGSGTDVYGYTWTDSNAPAPTVTYNWIEISGTGTDSGIEGDDDYGMIPIGFPFTYYGNTYQFANVSTNGLVQFGGGSWDYSNDPMPSTYSPNNIIAAYWDDICVNYAGYNYGSIYYQTIGTAPNQQLVVEWFEISRRGSYDLMTFEVILNQTGEIWFQYQTLSGTTGGSASVGIENSAGTIGLQYLYNSAILTDGLAIMFELGPIGFGPGAAKRAEAGSDATFWLNLTNNQPFTDSFDLEYLSSAGWGASLFDGTMAPLTDTNGNGIPDTGDLASLEVKAIVVVVTTPPAPSVQTDQAQMRATSYADPTVSAYVVLQTTVDAASIGTLHSDYGYDSDSDGTFDYLVVEVQIEVLFEMQYYMYVELWSPSSVYIQAEYVYPYLYPGTNYVDVWFEGNPIWAYGENGSMTVDIELYEYSPSVWIDSDTYVTGSYTYDEFDKPPVYFTTPSSDWGVDTDSDLLYDLLVVEIPIVVEVANEYYFVFNFWDNTRSWVIYTETNTSAFVAGAQSVRAIVPGWVLWSFGSDGPYYIQAYVYDEWGWAMWDLAEYVTASYLQTDFDDAAAYFAPPHSDSGLDDDSDGQFEYLMLNVSVDVSLPGTYQLYFEMYDSTYGAWLYSDTIVQDLIAGLNVVQVAIPGPALYAEGYDGPYDVDMILYDLDWRTVDTDSHTTAAYLYTDFADNSAWLTPPHQESTTDWDSDGLYDELTIDVSVEAFVSDWYELVITLYDQYGAIIETQTWDSFLWSGSAIISFTFMGQNLYRHGVDGPYNATLQLYDDWGVLIDSGYHLTAAYAFDDFEPPDAMLVPPYEDNGYDTDADGLFEYLSVNITINVTVSDWYELDVELYDSFGTYIDTAYWSDYCSVGIYTQELLFDSLYIFMNMVNGPYRLEIYLYQDWWDLMDNDTYWTQAYAYTAFKGPAGLFLLPFSDYGSDTDSDGLYEWLVIELVVEVYYADTFYLYSYVRTPTWDYLYGPSNSTYLDTGIHTVELWSPGERVFVGMEDGPFIVQSYLYDSAWNLLDYEETVTGAYAYDDFERPGAYFSPPHDDYAVDEDSDGLYDLLIVNVTVNVTVAGIYWIYAYMYDASWNDVGEFSESFTLSVGDEQIVQLVFDTWRLWSLAADGPYYLDMDLYADPYLWMDSDGYYTQAYSYGDFDPDPPVLNSVWTGTPPSIDGVFSPGEWDVATVVDLTDVDAMNEVGVVMMVANNDTHLFVCLDAYGDEWDDWDDSATIAFDTDDDDIATDGREDQFSIGPDVWNYQEHFVYDSGWGDWVDHCSPFDEGLLDHVGLQGAYGFGPSENNVDDHMVYEFAIPLSLLGVAPGDSIGFAVGGYYYMGLVDDYWDWSSWPYWFEDVPTLQQFGTLVLSDSTINTDVALDGTLGGDGWYVTQVTATMTTTGGSGGIDYTTYRLDGGSWAIYNAPVVFSADGDHVLEYYSVDMMGNSEAVQSVGFKIDLTPPTTTPSVAGSYDVTLSATDAASGVNYTWYRIDLGSWLNYTAEFTAGSTGLVVVEYFSVDLAGNAEPVKALYLGDTVAPETTQDLDGTLGDDGWYVSAVELTLDADDDLSGVAAIMVSVDDGPWQTYSGPLTVSADGEHTVEFYAIDNAGNDENEQSVDFMIDRTPPETDSSVAESVVTLTATDGTSGVSSTMYRIDGGDWETYTAPFEVTGAGNHTVEFYSEDVAGNEEDVQSIVVEVEDDGGGVLGSPLAWVGIIAAIVVVALLVLFLLWQKRRGAQPVMMPPPPAPGP